MKKTIKLKITGIKGEKGDTPSKDELVSIITPLIPEPIKGDKGDSIVGERGEKGEKGDDGYTPIKGVDYFDGEKGERGLRGFKGDPGKDVDENVIREIQAKVNRALDISSRDYDFTELKDVSITNPTNGQVPKYNSTTGKWENGNDTGSTSFITLTDTPNTYSGQAGKFPKVNAGETGLEFDDIPTPTTPPLQEVTDVGASTTTQSTFSGGIITNEVKANSSAGLSLKSNNGTDIALFGAGGGANGTFYGGVNFDTVTASRVAQFSASKTLESSSVTNTELGYVSGVTSAIQTQLNGKQASGTYVTGATNSTLTLTGTTLGLNLANANTWTGQQTFNTSATVHGVGMISPKWYPSADSTNAMGLYKADGTTQIMYVDTTNSIVGVKTGGVPSTNVLALQVGAKSYAGATTSMAYIQAVGGGSTEALTVVENASFTVAAIMSVRGKTGNALWAVNASGGTMSGAWTIGGGGTIVTSSAGGASYFGVAHVTSTSPGGYRLNATSDGNIGLYNVTQNYNPILGRDDTDGATAIGASITSRAFTTAGAKIVNFINNTTEKAYIDLNGGFTGLGQILNTLTTTQQEWRYDASNKANITVSNVGMVTFDAVGSGAGFTFSDQITGSSGYVGSDLTASLPVKTNGSKKLVSGAIDIASAEITGTLPIANGGTGVTSFGTGQVIFFNGTTQATDGNFTFGSNILTAVYVKASTNFKSSDGSDGWTGTFTTGDARTATVKGGIITDVS